MFNRKKLIFFGIAWIASVIIAYKIGDLLGSLDKAFKPTTETQTIKIGDEKVYFKKHIWGLLGNHSILYLTNNQQREYPDENDDLIFSGQTTLFFEVKNDTLIFYSRIPVSQDASFETNIPLSFNILDNHEFMKLYERFHNQQPLKCSDWL